MKKMMLLFFTFACIACTYGQPKAANDDPNSISYTDPAGTRYCLVSIGDKLPQLFVNGKELPAHRLEEYAGIVEKLQTQLWERQKKQGRQAQQDNDERVKAIVTSLVTDKVVNSAAALTSFRLDKDGFTVNGQKLSFEIFARYKTKFILSPDKLYLFNY
jgi:hypothetical protein